ncbi:MAG: valine--tRNA ligase [Acidobacteriota bacterium]|jgi:valyl-tRNA synthetase|nr:valine--tRNA ligase [Acidobacteriota bacterium]
MELSTQYNAKEAEKNHYRRWETSGCFKPEINEDADAETYSIVIPPPNVTGSLHMGHALQHTIMDVLTRRKRMLGFRTLFLPGIDHAGISTQLMVTRQLKEQENKTPQDIGREAFTKKVWEWKKQYGGTILNQMRREGISVDWSRERFTMDEELSKAVINVFVTLYEEGSIYRGARIVNWCPNDKTVLSDLEVEDKEKKDGKLYYLKYPIAVGEGEIKKFLTVATTRPETMLGDTAVAVNPNDKRFKNLIGGTIKLPLTNRDIPIIADEYVDMEFGTGAVKITPAHDPNDYEMGQRHNLPQLNVMNLDGTMNADAGEDFDGLDRYKARKLVVEKFEELGLLEKINDHELVLPICERCKTVVETLISEQWWVKMDEMRDMALELKRETDYPHFTPHNPHTKVYTDWLENLRDWTISRQLWWGHQIPAWYDEQGKIYVAKNLKEAIEKAGTENLTQDEDVLDTWFSSWLWSFSTLGWDGEEVQSSDQDEQRTTNNEQRTNDLNAFHPTDVLVTARDIIFLWVSRMVMSSLKFIGERPFDDVYITGTVLAKDGQRMSKTKGNGVDPIDIFDQYGVDATRITLAGSSTGMDFAWRDEKVETYRNFANKIWNATRFCLMNSEGAKVDVATLENAKTISDRWIISRLNKTAKEVNKSLDKYAFHVAVDKLYHFFWDDFCDWYIELVKDEISDFGQNEEIKDQKPKTEDQIEARTRIITILEQSLRLLHPFMPYLTEELWQKLPNTNTELHNAAYKSAEPTIMLADFPTGNAKLIDEKAESEMQTIFELITKIRNIRAEMQIKPSDKISVHISANEKTQKTFAANEAQILKLAGANEIKVGDKLDVPAASAKGVLTNGAEIAIPLEGLIDFEKERERLQNQINKLQEEGERLSKQLSNENFVNKAPAEKVKAVRERVTEIETQVKALDENLESLK